MKAVRFDEYGEVDVLEVREVADPIAGPGEVPVAVRAAGINPGEIGRLEIPIEPTAACLTAAKRVVPPEGG
jgi:hypothetical protein